MNEVEQMLINSIKKALQENLPEFSGTGISFDDPTIQIWDSTDDHYTSEVRLLVRRNGQIDDALEFHLFDGGRQVISLKAAMDWIVSELSKFQRSKL